MPQTSSMSSSPRGGAIEWRAWGSAAFDEAARSGRPVLLSLTAVWCQWCRRMDDVTYSDPSVIGLAAERLIPVRVDTDRYPHVQDRYITAGWPTTAFLTPTGEVLWTGTYMEPDALRQVADDVLAAWADRREELESEIGRRRLALETARGRTHGGGLVRREAADDVASGIRATFDPRNGGFGDAPKFPQPDALELMYAYAAEDPSWIAMADQTLDGMLAGELWDHPEGGFFRYASAADWTAPRHEKLLDVNAAMMEAYAAAGVLRSRDDWSEIAQTAAAWVDRTLALEGGLWGGSQAADPEYFAADAGARATMTRPPVDDTIYTAWNARWAGALAGAGARLGRGGWAERAGAAMRLLLDRMAAPNGGLYHYVEPAGEPHLDCLLADTLEALRAALTLAQATGDPHWLTEARRLARHMEAAFWAEDGGFWDRTPTDHDIGALRYRDRPFESNAVAARVLLDLAWLTGERHWRALAERTLARLAPQAGRYGPAGAVFALATGEFFERPPSVFVVTPERGDGGAAALREAAFRLPVPRLRVWTVPSGHSAGPQRFVAEDRAVACIWTARGCSAPIESPAQLSSGVDALVKHA